MGECISASPGDNEGMTNTENITAKHLLVGDTLLVGPRYPWGEDNPYRFPRSSRGDTTSLTVASIAKRRTAYIVTLSDGTIAEGGTATKFCRVVS